MVALMASYHLFSRLDNPVIERSLGRLSQIVLTVAVMLLLRATLSPRTGAVREFLALHRDGWLERLRFVWFSLILATPISFTVLSMLGFQYTVERLTVYLFWSVIYLSALYIIEAILSRWILINRRR